MRRVHVEMPVFGITRDTREQGPYGFLGIPQIDKALDFGDYAVTELEHLHVVERKEFQDYCNSVTVDHDRFWRELGRARAAFSKITIVVEGHLEWIYQGRYMGVEKTEQILGATAALAVENISVIFAGNWNRGCDLTRRILARVWEIERRARRARLLAATG